MRAGTSAAEFVLNIFKAALASTPFMGAFSSLLTDYIASGRFRRLEQFARDVAAELKGVSERVEQARIQTEEFAFIVERAFRGAAEHYQREKLLAFRGILVNSAIRTDVPQEEKEYFLALANNLSVLHLRMLRFMAEPKAYLAELDIHEDALRGGFTDMFRTVLPGLEASVVESAFGDLYQMGLISTPKDIFHRGTYSTGLELLGRPVTPVGLRFIEFCRVPRPEAGPDA